jgi:hypothetical protein
MAPEPASGDPVEPPPAAAERASADTADERYGEVELSRQRKEDGRALILYRWQPDGEVL